MLTFGTYFHHPAVPDQRDGRDHLFIQVIHRCGDRADIRDRTAFGLGTTVPPNLLEERGVLLAPR